MLLNVIWHKISKHLHLQQTPITKLLAIDQLYSATVQGSLQILWGHFTLKVQIPPKKLERPLGSLQEIFSWDIIDSLQCMQMVTTMYNCIVCLYIVATEGTEVILALGDGLYQKTYCWRNFLLYSFFSVLPFFT